MTDCHVLVVSLAALREKMGPHWMLERKRTLLHANPELVSLVLETVPFFQHCSDVEMRELGRMAAIITRPARTVLITEGGTGDGFFLILHGTVDVAVKGVSVSKSGPGQFFGETSIIKGVPCTVSGRCVHVASW